MELLFQLDGGVEPVLRVDGLYEELEWDVSQGGCALCVSDVDCDLWRL